MGEVRQLLPRTARVLGKNFTSFFWQYGESYLPQGIKKHHQDAIAFANFITKATQQEQLEPIWISDLVRYEKTWLLVNEPHHRLHICWFRYPVDKLGNTEKIPTQPTIAVWWRYSLRSPLHHLLLPLAIKQK